MFVIEELKFSFSFHFLCFVCGWFYDLSLRGLVLGSYCGFRVHRVCRTVREEKRDLS